MSAAESKSLGSCQKEGNDAPPPLSIKLPKLGELPGKSEPVSDDQPPVGILLLTVEDCEFLACYVYLRNPVKRYHKNLGHVYFGSIGDDNDDEPLKIALLKCSAGSLGPGGAQTVVKNAVMKLRPKAIYCVGCCEGLKPEDTQLGDVVVSSKLTTEDLKTPMGKDIGNLIKNSTDGWIPPLEKPDAHQVHVHRDGEILSSMDRDTAKRYCEVHPRAIALEMEGRGIFVAAHDLKMEWVIVKGISHFADSNKTPDESWKSYACVMAASLVFNMLNDTVVFQQWPHYRDVLSVVQDPAPSKEMSALSCSITQTPQQSHTTAADHAGSTDSPATKQSRWSKVKGFFKRSTTGPKQGGVRTGARGGAASGVAGASRGSKQAHYDKGLEQGGMSSAGVTGCSGASKRAHHDQVPEQGGVSSTSGTVAGCSYHDQGPKQGGVRIGARGGAASGVAGASQGSKQAHYDKGLEQEGMSSAGVAGCSAASKRAHHDQDSATAFLKWSQSQLRSFYNSTASQVMITPWDPDNTMDIDEVYVQLSLLRDDRKLAGTTKEKLKDYSEIFEGRGHHLIPKRILVYGRPGIGKSTFTKKLAVDWSRDEKEILKKFSVSLLIKLRDVCNIEDISALLRQAELLSADDPKVFNQLYKYILENQRQVLLIFDGYDEFSAETSSPVHQIWRGSQLRDCTVLVTTRPSKEDELRPPSHVQFEINGFNLEQVIQFARKFLCDQVDIDEFLQFLTKHSLWDMVEIPLLLLMLCLTFKGKDHRELPTSRANLYESFFQTLFDHMAAKTTENEFRSIDEYKEDLSKLGKLAYDALLNDCLYFKLSKLPEDIRLLIEKFIDVGFFQVSKLSTSPRPEHIALFLHKTIQEFLSARFIVQGLTNSKKETLHSLSKVDSLEKIENMLEVLKFVCELSPEGTEAVLSHLQKIGEKEGLTEYNFTENTSVEELSEDQRKFCRISLDCFLSCSASDRQAIYPLFLQCVNSVVVIDFESQLPTVVARERFLRLFTLSKPDYLFVDNLYVMQEASDDLLSVMRDLETVVVTCYGDNKSVNNYASLPNDFFLKKEGQQTVLYLTRIHKGFSSNQLPVELLTALTSAPESPPQKPVDHVSQNQDDGSSLNLTEKTTDQTLKHSLSFVREITIAHPTSEELTVVSNALAFVNRPRKVDIVLSVLQSCEAQLMKNCFSHILSSCFTNNLVELKLNGLNLSATCAADIARSLHQAPNLHKLDLSANTLCSGVRDLAENLHQLPHLTELKLNKVDMGDQECRVLATSLQHVVTLQVLDLSFNALGRGIVTLGRHLHSVPHLTELRLHSTQMSEEEIKAVARGLQSVPDLKILDLSDNPLGHGIIELTLNLRHVPHLTKLNLCRTQIGKEEVTAIARALNYVPELEWLDLSFNPLGRGVSELIQHLSSIPQLGYLDLSGVQMTKKEASELCSAVRGKWIYLLTNYHTFDGGFGEEWRLRTEDELKEVSIKFDKE